MPCSVCWGYTKTKRGVSMRLTLYCRKQTSTQSSRLLDGHHCHINIRQGKGIQSDLGGTAYLESPVQMASLVKLVTCELLCEQHRRASFVKYLGKGYCRLRHQHSVHLN